MANVAGVGREERASIPPAGYPNFIFQEIQYGLKIIFAVLKNSR